MRTPFLSMNENDPEDEGEDEEEDDDDEDVSSAEPSSGVEIGS